MKNRIFTILLVASSLFLTFVNSSFGDESKGEQVLASVTELVTNIADEKQGPRVNLWMTIHVPSRFGGYKFVVNTESVNKKEVSEEFPIGSLQLLNLPAETIEAFVKQADARSLAEKSESGGIDPSVIMFPGVAMADIPRGLVSYIVTKQFEQNVPVKSNR